MTEYFTLAKVDEEPKEGPSCWIRDKTLSRVDIGPVINHLDTMPGAETREIIVLSYCCDKYVQNKGEEE